MFKRGDLFTEVTVYWVQVIFNSHGITARLREKRAFKCAGAYYENASTRDNKRIAPVFESKLDAVNEAIRKQQWTIDNSSAEIEKHIKLIESAANVIREMKTIEV